MWIVKGYKEREKAFWVTQLAHLLHEQGFHRTVHYVSTDEGQQVFLYEGRYYTVMKTIEGREANYASVYDVKKAATSLAQFHQAAQAIPFVPESYTGNPPIFDKWEDRLQHFERISHKIASRGPVNRMEHLIVQMTDEMKRDASLALQQMKQQPFDEEMYQAFSQGTLAHRDVASHNFLITQRGNCYLIDLDTVHSDMQLVDLAQFMSRMLLLQGYQMNAFIDAIHAYSKTKPLSDQQMKLLLTMLRYPDNFLREVTGLYARRSGYRVRGVTQLLLLKRRFAQERRNFLKQANRTIHYWRQGPQLYGAG